MIRCLKTKIILGIYALTILYLITLHLQIPVFQSFPYWWGKLHITHLPQWWILILILILSLLCLRLIFKNPSRYIRNLLCLILLGYTIQMGFGWMSGSGIEGIRHKVRYNTHKQFATFAAGETSMPHVLHNYQDLLQNGTLPQYPFASKPPGTLLFYMATERLSRIPIPFLGDEAFDRLTTLMTLLFPLLTYLVLVPLFFLARLFLGGPHIYFPLFLYLFVPSVILHVRYLDQCLYPLLFITPISLFVYAIIKCRNHLFALVGVMIYLSIFFTYALVALIPFMFLLGIICFFKPGLLPIGVPMADMSFRGKMWSFSKYLLLVFAGFSAIYLIFYLILDYNALSGYRTAMAYHHSFKIQDWTFINTVYIGIVGILEYALFLGLPLSILVSINFRKALDRLIGGKLKSSDCLTIPVSFVFLLLTFLGRTTGETARLWLFIVPVMIICSTVGLLRVFSRNQTFGLLSVSFLQLMTVFFLKMHQDPV